MQPRIANNQQPKPEAYLNVVLVDANGNKHTFKSNIPLFRDRASIDNTLLNNPDLVKTQYGLSREQIELEVYFVREVNPDEQVQF